jgi:hypothetical protein
VLRVRPSGIEDVATSRAIDEIVDAAIGPGLLTGAVLVKDIALAAGVLTRVRHNLGRRAVGYLVTSRRNVTTAPLIEDENNQHGDLDKFLYLKAVGGSLTVDLAVF